MENAVPIEQTNLARPYPLASPNTSKRTGDVVIWFWNVLGILASMH